MYSKKKKPFPKKKIYTGIVDHVSTQCAYIIVEQLEKDILVPQAYLQGAMHNDTVEVSVVSSQKEGCIVKILKRANTQVIGRISRQRDRYLVLPDHKRFHHPIEVIPEEDHTFQPDDKVVITLTHYPTARHTAKGKIKEVLGPMGSHHAETQAIIAQFELQEKFSSSIEKEVAQFLDQLAPEEIARRRDFRAVTTFTIDPVDAKDFDDALSLRTLPNGDHEVGIHVADVTHHVKPQTPLDEEAQRRATSVYLVGHVVPMLPERLANDLCSLKPHVDRPAFSLIATLDKKAQVKKIEIAETIIHSDHRFTYDEAHQVLFEKKGPFHQELALLDGLAKQLRKQRIQEGAICFESSDIDIQLDKKGNPTHIKAKKAHATHQLIEEFMLLANRLVARTMWGKKEDHDPLPFIYRVHDRPEAQKVSDFARFARKLGYPFDTQPDQLPQSYNRILAASKGTAHEAVVQMLSIRTMSQAAYSTAGKQHFGLGFPHYTHFTSPIRRYPDLIVHRLVKGYLGNQLSRMKKKEEYEGLARHASARERLAVEAERASIAYKQTIFMKKLEGKAHAGMIVGMTEWGIYVELKEYKCEGMVRLADIDGDYYIYDPVHFQVKGRRKGKIYQMGDAVRVLIKNANIARRQVDMIMV